MSSDPVEIVHHPKTPAELEFIELVGKCYKEKPDKKELAALRQQLDQTPELWSKVFDLGEVINTKIVTELIKQPAAKIGLDANIGAIKGGLGYDQAPMIEQLLIDSIVTAWLRWQWAELRYGQHISGEHRISEGEYWLHVAGATQRRYLHAVETLARVRKITRATVQVNIAEAGSQQVNIAGDLVRP